MPHKGVDSREKLRIGGVVIKRRKIEQRTIDPHLIEFVKIRTLPVRHAHQRGIRPHAHQRKKQVLTVPRLPLAYALRNRIRILGELPGHEADIEKPGLNGNRFTGKIMG